MKYQYTCYDYTKILDLSTYTLKLDKDSIVECAAFDKDGKTIVLKIRNMNGIEVMTINTSNLVIENE